MSFYTYDAKIVIYPLVVCNVKISKRNIVNFPNNVVILEIIVD